MPKKLPILLASGTADPVGSYGEGVRRVEKKFLEIGLEHVDLRLYPADRHEILNELDREQIYSDLEKWIQGCIRDEAAGADKESRNGVTA